jgi:hypothetical protein
MIPFSVLVACLAGPQQIVPLIGEPPISGMTATLRDAGLRPKVLNVWLTSFVSSALAERTFAMVHKVEVISDGIPMGRNVFTSYPLSSLSFAS